MENKMIDKDSTIYEVIKELEIKDSISATVPYPYLAGLIWGMLNQTQMKTLVKIVNEMENK
jgi:hypothetical protein